MMNSACSQLADAAAIITCTNCELRRSNFDTFTQDYHERERRKGRLYGKAGRSTRGIVLVGCPVRGARRYLHFPTPIGGAAEVQHGGDRGDSGVKKTSASREAAGLRVFSVTQNIPPPFKEMQSYLIESEAEFSARQVTM